MNFITLVNADTNRIFRLNINHIEQYEIGSEFKDGKLKYKEDLTQIVLINGKVILVKENVLHIDVLISEERKDHGSCYGK